MIESISWATIGKIWAFLLGLGVVVELVKKLKKIFI